LVLRSALKKLALCSAMAVLTVSAPAKIGETMTQALVRLGQPEKKAGDQKNAIWTWKREQTVTAVQFENSRNVAEMVEKTGGLSSKELSEIFAKAGPGAWNPVPDPRHPKALPNTFSNGPLLAVHQGWRITITANPKAAPVEPVPEKRIAPAKPVVMPPKEITPAAPVEPPVVATLRTYGKTVSTLPEGLLFQCSSGDFTGRVLLIDFPSVTPIPDGTELSALVKKAGAFEYQGPDGKQTIPKLQFDGPIPEPSATPVIARPPASVLPPPTSRPLPPPSAPVAPLAPAASTKPTGTIKASGISAGKVTESNWESDWGTYDRDYARQQLVEVIVSPWGKGEAEAKLETLWFGRTVVGNDRVILRKLSQPVTLKAGAGPSKKIVASGVIASNVQKYSSLGLTYGEGSKIEGWYIRLMMDGKLLSEAASASYLVDLCHDPEKLSKVADVSPDTDKGKVIIAKPDLIVLPK